METYRHSGSVPLGGFLSTFLIGTTAAAIGGIIYAYAIYYVPIIYLNLLLTVGFGIAMGALVGAMARRGCIRNTFVVAVLGLGAGIVGVYAAWVGTMLALGLADGLRTADPMRIMTVMKFLYMVGYWEFHGDTLKGVPLALVWLLEAGTIVFLATRSARAAIAQLPFCERCGQWTETEQGVQHLLLRPEDEIALDRITAGHVATLNDMERLGDEGGDHVQLDLATCPSCSDSNFLTVKAVRLSVDRKGQVKAATQTLLMHGLIGENDVALVRDAGRVRPELPAASTAEAETASE